MIWTAVWSNDCKKQLDKLPQEIGDRIILKIRDVEQDPFTYIERLKNSELYKLRVGNYRILITVLSNKMILHLVKVAKRSNVYD